MPANAAAGMVADSRCRRPIEPMPSLPNLVPPAPDAAAAAAVLVGRFQPIHLGHLALLERALAAAPRVIVVIGSAWLARSPAQPFSWRERAAMIAAAVGDRADRLAFVPVRDCGDDARWRAAVERAVRELVGEREPVRLVAARGGPAQEALRGFRGWELEIMPRRPGVGSGALRRALFAGATSAAGLAVLRDHLPAPVLDYLRAWVELPWLPALTADWRELRIEGERWAGAPQLPLRVSADAVVRVGDSVLLVRRAGPPGEGLWALPGASPERGERLAQAAMRALREQTGIGLLTVSLEDALRSATVFDHPRRAWFGRAISHAHRFELGGHLPGLRGGEPAPAAWVPLAGLPACPESLYEDHYAILDHFFELGDLLHGPDDGRA
jgi:bifunctional NMN adenylyltransferase/nudix hydrolase